MPQHFHDETARFRRQSLLNGDEHEDWQDDYRAITGEEWSVRSLIFRIHPGDVARVIAAWVRSQTSQAFDETYRLLDSRGCYVCVRGRVWHIAPLNVWTGVLRRMDCADRIWWPVVPITHDN
jgi:hypothetical protein